MRDEIQVHEGELPRAVLADVGDDFLDRLLKRLPSPFCRHHPKVAAMHAAARGLKNIAGQQVPRGPQIGLLDLSTAHVNHRGTGSDQYPPSMMLGLLIYCSATGTFSSRRIEQLTYENVAVRFLCADRHPDHDSICTFRRENRALLETSFHQVLEGAARLRVLRVGDVTLALDGTKILASASQHSAVSYDHALKQMVLLEE
jgi:transposase